MFDDFAARQLGSEAAKSVMGNTESILAPMAGEEAIVHERLASVTSAGEGEITAKFVKDVRAIRRKDDKFETEKVVLVDSSSEHESIVGWGCEIADEWLTRGASNEIHICDSNMNGSYEREAISRRYPNNEKSIQSNPSPEFLNSLPFIKKFYPVLNLLHAPRVPQKQRGCSLLHLLAIRTRCTPSVRKFAAPLRGEGKVTEIIHEIAAIHVIPSDSEGI